MMVVMMVVMMTAIFYSPPHHHHHHHQQHHINDAKNHHMDEDEEDEDFWTFQINRQCNVIINSSNFSSSKRLHPLAGRRSICRGEWLEQREIVQRFGSLESLPGPKKKITTL